jgi:hypothetical protein
MRARGHQASIFSAVAVGNPVPNSSITGSLTDVNTGAPIAGVQVSTLPVTTTATTNASGIYSLSLPAGNFVVVFTAFSVGYNSNFVGGVQAPVNGTVSANEKLTPIADQTGIDTFTQPNQSNAIGVSNEHVAKDFARYPSAQAGITNGQACRHATRARLTSTPGWDTSTKRAGSVGST